MYQLVIFDSDGTLADTLPWMRSVFNELADEHGFKRVEEHELEHFRDLHGAALLKALELPLWKLPRVVSSMRALMARHTGTLSLFDGMADVLQRLSAGGIQLAVVSSNSRANVERVLGPDNARLIAHYDCGAAMFGKAGRIRRVIRKTAILARDAIYVGDEVRDAEAARKAGIAFGAVAWGQDRPETLQAQNPAEFFSCVQDLATKLCGKVAP